MLEPLGSALVESVLGLFEPVVDTVVDVALPNASRAVRAGCGMALALAVVSGLIVLVIGIVGWQRGGA